MSPKTMREEARCVIREVSLLACDVRPAKRRGRCARFGETPQAIPANGHDAAPVGGGRGRSTGPSGIAEILIPDLGSHRTSGFSIPG